LFELLIFVLSFSEKVNVQLRMLSVFVKKVVQCWIEPRGNISPDYARGLTGMAQAVVRT
jgi:hypothetical protein